jgi:hypothetical protein
VAPLSAIFAVSGVALAGSWVLAGKLHPRLGLRRIQIPVPEAAGEIFSGPVSADTVKEPAPM